ncbi:hypothetical protein [uncultured Desulfosarcina sp.]|uniref:hypothetical protein n=1 Tax=uncultured Desulfosarcina sp. TaxID=218289 RepID=UPI0029C6686C|nr:hypothetical protein [uncultured Desulfosarcina sp.]
MGPKSTCLRLLLSEYEAHEVASGLEDSDILEMIDKIVQCYQETAKKGEHIGKTIERIGLENFKTALR